MFAHAKARTNCKDSQKANMPARKSASQEIFFFLFFFFHTIIKIKLRYIGALCPLLRQDFKTKRDEVIAV